MVVFPHAKINLGLNILRRRADGYHDIDSAMVPVGWCDILEIVPAKDNARPQFVCRGKEELECPDKDNLVIRAYNAVKSLKPQIPAVDIYLHKNIPSGAGLGGGSADAAYTIRGLNGLFSLGLGKPDMAAIASGIGADCPFFIYDSPMAVSGIGTTLQPTDIPALRGMDIVVCRPDNCHVSTAQAYAGVTPDAGAMPVEAITRQPISRWREGLCNMFEKTVFELFPAIAQLKEYFYNSGAAYAAMSGSGAAVFAIFDKHDKAQQSFDTLQYRFKYIGKL